MSWTPQLSCKLLRLTSAGKHLKSTFRNFSNMSFFKWKKRPMWQWKFSSSRKENSLPTKVRENHVKSLQRKRQKSCWRTVLLSISLHLRTCAEEKKHLKRNSFKKNITKKKLNHLHTNAWFLYSSDALIPSYDILRNSSSYSPLWLASWIPQTKRSSVEGNKFVNYTKIYTLRCSTNLPQSVIPWWEQAFETSWFDT